MSLPVFGGPVLALGIFVAISTWRDRRRGATKASRVEVSYAGEEARVAVVGPLDRAALVEIESELASARGIFTAVLDLRRTTSVEPGCRRRLERMLRDDLLLDHRVQGSWPAASRATPAREVRRA